MYLVSDSDTAAVSDAEKQEAEAEVRRVPAWLLVVVWPWLETHSGAGARLNSLHSSAARPSLPGLVQHGGDSYSRGAAS